MNEADAKKAIRCMLDAHEGIGNEITAGEMARTLGWFGRYDDRKVRLMIEDMIFNEGLAVISNDKGYCKPLNWAEWEECHRVNRGRAEEICKRDAVMEKNIHNYFYGVQKVRMI